MGEVYRATDTRLAREVALKFCTEQFTSDSSARRGPSRLSIIPTSALHNQTKGDAFSSDQPRVWSDVGLAPITQRNLDIAPDGKRFVVLLPTNSPEADTLRNHVVFVQNFGDELRRRVGGGK